MKQYEILQFLRKKRNLSQRKLADKISISRSTYSRLETEDQAADIDVLIEILEALDATLEDFIELLSLDSDLSIYKKKYHALFNAPTAVESQKVYSFFESNKHINLKYFSYYTSFFFYFQEEFPNLLPCKNIIQTEIQNKLDEIINSEYHTLIDFKFSANNVYFSTQKQKIDLVNNLIFSKNLTNFALKGEGVRLAIAQLLNNIIDDDIRLFNFDNLSKYIKKQQEILIMYPSQQYSTLLQFHIARLHYFNNPTRDNHSKMTRVVEHYEWLGYSNEVISLTKDINAIIHSENSDKPNILEGWQ